MTAPDLAISQEALDHIREAVGSWRGDTRDLALAMATISHAVLLLLDGRSDHIALYEQAARAVAPLANPQGTA